MKNLIYFTLITALVTSLMACNDPFRNEKLPPITQTGENTFGFKLDGEVWLPYYRGLKFDNNVELLNRYTPENGGFRIESTREKSDVKQIFYFSSNNIKSENFDIFDYELITQTGSKSYFLLNSDTLRFQFYFDDRSFSNNLFTLNHSSNNSIFISKIDTLNKVISGEFEFTLRNHDGRQLKITEGRFDFNYPYER